MCKKTKKISPKPSPLGKGAAKLTDEVVARNGVFDKKSFLIENLIRLINSAPSPKGKAFESLKQYKV